MSTSTSRPWRARAARALVALGVLATGALATQGSAQAAGPRNVRGHAVAHVFIASTGFPGFTNGWKWSSVHGEATEGFDATRNGVGDYQIVFNGIKGPGHVQLTPWTRDGVRNPPVCTVAGQTATTAGVSIRVRCFSALTGTPREGLEFDVQYTSERTTGVEDFLYLLSDDATPDGVTPVPAATHWTSAAPLLRPVVSRSAVGRYDVHVQHSMEGGWPRVTARSRSARWCTPVSVRPDRSVGVHVRVNCYGPGGVAADSRFFLDVTADDPLTGVLSLGANLRITNLAATATVTPTVGNTNTGTFQPSNTHRKTATGEPWVEMAEVGMDVPSGWAQAWGTTANRCHLASYVGSALDPTAAGLTTVCVRPNGRVADTVHVASRWDRPTVDLSEL